MNISEFQFRHHRLPVYTIALKLATRNQALCKQIPRGHRALADQLSRASMSTVLLIAEGANRQGAGEKRHRFNLALGEVGEVAAAVELATVLGFIDDAEAVDSLTLANRVAAMLTRLVQRFS